MISSAMNRGSKDEATGVKQKTAIEKVANQTIKSLYEQLVNEAPKESQDPRRLHLLKHQIFMLERQCHNMTVQLNERHGTQEHAYATLEGATREMERWISTATQDKVTVSKNELSDVLKTIRGVGRKLNKPSETSETVIERQNMSNKFCETIITPQDIFKYNIKQMSNLEHKLSELAVSVQRFNYSILEKPILRTKTKSGEASVSIRDFSSCRDDYDKSVATLSKQLDDCSFDITQLSLLQPQLQFKNKKITKEITLDFIIEYLKKFTRKKEVFETIPLVWQLANHQAKVLKMRTVMLDGELLRCHRRLELHTKFVIDLLSGFESMFLDFERNWLVPQISEPLSSTIDTYTLLQNEQTNENLAEFFKKFDDLIPNLQKVLVLLNGSLKMENSSELQGLFRGEIVKFTKSCLLERKKNENEIAGKNKTNEESKKKLNSVLELKIEDYLSS